MKRRLWRKVHRWAGLFLSGFVLFYCLTGVLLNHRRVLGYFQNRHVSVSPVQVQEQGDLQRFLAGYKEQINRRDPPKIIRIRDNGVVEFLYGSHGRTTYAVDPHRATLTRTDKIDKQPWHWLNGLHKASMTSTFWLILTDSAALMLCVLTLSGLVILRYTRRDFLLLALGLLVLFIGAAAA